MAKVKLDEPFASISGGVGPKHFVRKRGTQLILARKPTTTREPSERQLNQQERFAEGSEYAALAMSDPVKRLFYQGLKTADQSPNNMAMADFFAIPVIRNLDASNYSGHPGASICVEAYQKFCLTAVTVRINRADGTLIEEGPATRRRSTNQYCYLTTLENPELTGTVITVTATDIPEHVVELSITL